MLASLIVLLAVSSASAAPAGADLQLDLGVEKRVTLNFPFVPNGGTVNITGLDFVAGWLVQLANRDPGSAKIEFRLAEGLNWGADGPDENERCTPTPYGAQCDTPILEPTSTGSAFGIGWNVIAAQPGTYVLRAEIASTSTPDPNPANNAASVTVVVTQGGATGGGGGGGASVTASAVRLTPAKPKAGAVLTATVQVTAGGTTVRPTRVVCAGNIGATKLRGTPRAAAGSASCAFRTPRSAGRKTLRGSISFTAQGQRFTKRFSARLG